jgi:hypothetical protein
MTELIPKKLYPSTIPWRRWRLAVVLTATGRLLSGIGCAQRGRGIKKQKPQNIRALRLPGSKNRLLMNVPRPGFRNLAASRREYESKILFH